MNTSQILIGIKCPGQLTHHDRMITTLCHILFTRPDQLDWCAWHSFSDQDSLCRVVLKCTATTESTKKSELFNDGNTENLFGNRTFATQLSVAGGTYKGDFIAKGTVMPNGLFEADAGRSNMSLAGGLGGNPADQAAYIFSGRMDANAIAAGGTFWRKVP